ncbi:glutathione S-transferase [Aspergillus cavernicola]|uniref:Glutathione S-transferase n=1 Tax=Aspergillus cavernicola TaxID=176166 RepID=A0ABR4I7Q5_9EURO
MALPIKVYTHASGPNPAKVIMILKELSLPYTPILVASSDVKSPPFTLINPNGRLPAIEDPNTGITLWESGAIIEYLIETYDDKDHTISFERGSEEYFHAKQFLHFQMSGQGPYFGQAVWFLFYHAEKIASAQERYLNEIRRVTGVLEGILGGGEEGEKKKEYLVGGRFSYVDAAFVPWFEVVPVVTDSIDLAKDFPNVKAWLDRVQGRKAIAESIREWEEARAAEKK